MSVLKEGYNISVLDFYTLKNIFYIKCISIESFLLLFFYIFFQGLNAGVANARCASLVFFLLFLYFYILFFQGLMQALPTLDAQVGVVAAATASPCH